MENFNLFITLMLADLSYFLMSEPIIWFVGLVILAFLVKILGMIISHAIR
jgi:membrane protein YdbS with pleckstrin-like domain